MRNCKIAGSSGGGGNGGVESERTSESRSSFLARSQSYALLKQQMEVAAKSEDYKEAARIKDSLKAFEDEEHVLHLRNLFNDAIAEERFADAVRYRDELKDISPHFRRARCYSRFKDRLTVGSVFDERDVIPVQSSDSTDQPEGVVVGTEREIQGGEILSQIVSGFANEGRLSLEGGGGEFQSFSSSSADGNDQEEDVDKLIDKSINACIFLAAGTFAITKLLTIDHDYWHVSVNAESCL